MKISALESATVAEASERLACSAVVLGVGSSACRFHLGECEWYRRLLPEHANCLSLHTAHGGGLVTAPLCSCILRWWSCVGHVIALFIHLEMAVTWSGLSLLIKDANIGGDMKDDKI